MIGVEISRTSKIKIKATMTINKTTTKAKISNKMMEMEEIDALEITMMAIDASITAEVMEIAEAMVADGARIS